MGKQKTITIPEGWDEISVRKFQEIQLIDKESYDSNILYMIDIISILADVDKKDVSGINIKNLQTIAENMDWLQTDVPTERKHFVKIGDDVYKWKGDFNSVTVGEMVSLEQVIDLEQLNFSMTFDVILAIFLRKVLEDGTLEEFKAEDFEKNREKFSELKITDVYGMIVFFSLGETSYINNSQDYSQVQRKKKKKKN